jgi:protein SCO1/2
MFRKPVFLFILVLLCGIMSSNAQDNTFGILNKTGDFLPADVYLFTQDSVKVRFGDLIDKPTLLSFVYFRCPGLCSPVMNGIAEIIQKTHLQIGKDYQVITIGINYKEALSLARDKKKSYLKTIPVEGVEQGWNFYKADSSTVKLLTDAAGWQFKRTGNDFVHGAATILLTPDGKISDYFYGTFILPMEFQLAVQDARNGLTGTPRPKDLKYCYNFTPARNMTSSLMISIGGIVLLVSAVILFIWLSLKPVQHQKTGNS